MTSTGSGSSSVAATETVDTGGATLQSGEAMTIVNEKASPGSNVWKLVPAPKPPQEVLKLTLKRSYWETFVSTVRGLPRQLAVMKIKAEKMRILSEAYKRGSLSKDDADFLNAAMRHDVDAVFDQFEKELKKLLKIEPGELPQSAMVKIELVQQITVWLDNLVQ